MNGESMKFFVSLLLASTCAVAIAQPEFKEPLGDLSPKQKEFRALAIKGDYQGMRNIAYSYAAPFKGEAGSKVSACAWYLLIPAVHKAKFDSGDIGNVFVYCNKALDRWELDAAYDYAFRKLAASSK